MINGGGDNQNNTWNTNLPNNGILCCYYEENFPICFVDENLLEFLEYSSKAEFLDACNHHYHNAICPEDRTLFESALRVQLKASNEFALEYRLQKNMGGLIWIYCIGKKYEDEEGRQRLLATCFNITSIQKVKHHDTYLSRSSEAQKELERRYQQMLSFEQFKKDKKIVAVALFNVETGKMEKWVNNYEFLNENQSPEEYMTMIETLGKFLLPEYKEDFFSTFHIDNVRKLCREGKTEHFLEYERISNKNTIGYFRGTQTFMENPYTGEVMCILIVRDITDQKTIQLIVRKIVEAESDFVTIIDVVNNTVKVSINSQSGYLVPRLEQNYDVSLEKAMREMIVSEEIEDSIQSMRLENLVKEIDKNGSFTCAFSIWNKETQRSERKLWKFSYFDETKKEIIYSRSDITQVYEKEKKQSEALESALSAAQQANDAKTNFLSSMSHEIRTPMNAIIGMTTIASQSIGNTEQMEECISKIDTSAKFLLSLINDILDMSRIESGKMVLKNEKMPMEDFLNSVTYICYSQAAAKQIDFECVVDPEIDHCYIGDAMKLQQVLINILSNGIKFTDKQGKITFSVIVKEKREKESVLRFIIKDTGVGMSDEFLDKLYDPFSQENMSITTKYGGTGLGLAISKSIIDMMGGNISVRSSKGIGTEFTIDVTLGLSEDSQESCAEGQDDIFQDLAVLILGDNAATCQSIAEIVKEIGAGAEWVDSERKATECIKSMDKANNYFNMIIIDWNMQGLSGLEATQQIHRIVENKNTKIMVTAFDWMAIEQEAKMAGADFLMSKPVLKSSLISTFCKALGQDVENRKMERIEDFDFSGKRILLVEDHPLNVEIAMNLLEGKGFAVETAENGLHAIKIFSEKASGYYDAILMDIRMPVMDGLQATKEIRQLKHPDAKTIPIIAMTANAFEEDIEKSKEAGMNAHLAKPIEPQKMYRTLHDFISNR